MENLDQYISSLLENHDCVIIPDFGGLVLNKVPASFGDSLNEIHPPAKILSFNRNLNVNDGLLAHYISVKENISYPEALMNVDKEVFRMKLHLSGGESIHLQNIGSIIQDNEGKIIFSPSNTYNFLASSYGLPALSLRPLEKQQESRIYKLREQKLRPLKEERTPVRRSLAPVISIAASIIFAMVVFFQNYQSDPAKTAMAVYRGHFHIQPSQANQTAATQPKKHIPGLWPTDLTASNEPSTKPIKTEASFNPFSKFYVVGGSFKKESNAKNLLEKLKKRGFEAQVLNTENGLFRVTYYNETDSTRADKVLHKIKISENQSAWLLKW